jgi:hypothetical protein
MPQLINFHRIIYTSSICFYESNQNIDYKRVPIFTNDCSEPFNITIRVTNFGGIWMNNRKYCSYAQISGKRRTWNVKFK